MGQYTLKVNGSSLATQKDVLTGREILNLADLKPAEDFELLLKVSEKGFTPIQLDEVVDLTQPGIEGFRAKPYKHFVINVDGMEVELEELFSTPREILSLVSKNHETHYLVQTTGSREVDYRDDVDHRIQVKNGLTFISQNFKWSFCIENELHSWEKRFITGAEVRAIPPGVPANMDLFVKYKGKPGRLVALGDSIDLGQIGVEKFYAQVADSTPGSYGNVV